MGADNFLRRPDICHVRGTYIITVPSLFIKKTEDEYNFACVFRLSCFFRYARGDRWGVLLGLM